MKKATGYVVFFFVFLILVACGGNKDSKEDHSGKTIIKIGYLPVTHALPLFVEKEKFEENQDFSIELVKFGSWPDMMDALNTGRIDGASVLITLAMKAKSQGIDLKAVALGHRDGNVIVVSNDIMQVSDLKGKSFAIPHKFSAHNILRYEMLKQARLQESDVNVIELPPAEMPAALSEGRISGYVVAEPFGAVSIVAKNGKVLYQSEQLWKESLDCALVLREDFMKSHKNITEAFVRQYVQSGEFADKKDHSLQDIAANYMKIDDEVMDLSLTWISYSNLRINKEAYEVLLKAVKEMNLFENPPTYEEFVNTSFIDKVK